MTGMAGYRPAVERCRVGFAAMRTGAQIPVMVIQLSVMVGVSCCDYDLLTLLRSQKAKLSYEVGVLILPLWCSIITAELSHPAALPSQ